MKTKTVETPGSWLEELPTLKTSDDFQRALAGLNEEHAAASKRLRELMSEQENALFTGADLSGLRRQIDEARNRMGTLDAAIAGAQTRREEAGRSELETEIEEIREDSARRAHILEKAWEKVVVQVPALRETLAVADREGTAIDNNNSRLETLFQKLGRPLMKLPQVQTNVRTIKRLALGLGGAPGADILPNLSRMGRANDDFLRDLALFRQQSASPTYSGRRGI